MHMEAPWWGRAIRPLPGSSQGPQPCIRLPLPLPPAPLTLLLHVFTQCRFGSSRLSGLNSELSQVSPVGWGWGGLRWEGRTSCTEGSPGLLQGSCLLESLGSWPSQAQQPTLAPPGSRLSLPRNLSMASRTALISSSRSVLAFMASCCTPPKCCLLGWEPFFCQGSFRYL